MDPLIVSAADAEYFPLLKGLVLSIRQNAPDQSTNIAAVDLGLTESRKSELNELGVRIVTIDWKTEFAQRTEAAPWEIWITARADLPRYVPGAEIYIWLDADVWFRIGGD